MNELINRMSPLIEDKALETYEPTRTDEKKYIEDKLTIIDAPASSAFCRSSRSMPPQQDSLDICFEAQRSETGLAHYQ